MTEQELKWYKYFMFIAKITSIRSKDPNTKVGAVIVNEDYHIIGTGYNGLPRGCDDKDYPWDIKEGEFLSTKYPYIVHAEANAIANSTCKVKGASIFVTLFPCNECTKLIIQNGIKKVFYLEDRPDRDWSIASKTMFNDCKVEYINLGEMLKGEKLEIEL